MTATDLSIAGPVLAAALWLLYRSVFKARGACHGCAGGCRPARGHAGDDLVREIGRVRR